MTLTDDCETELVFDCDCEEDCFTVALDELVDDERDPAITGDAVNGTSAATRVRTSFSYSTS